MKRFFRAFAIVLVAVGLNAGTAVPSQAAPRLVDVTGFSAKSIVVSNYSNSNCRDVAVAMRKTMSPKVGSWDVMSGVYRGGSSVDTAFYSDSGDRSKTRVTVCPWVHGLGKYTVGPSYVSADTRDGYDYQSYTDWTKGHFYVRAKGKAALKGKRKGNTVTLTASAQRYNPKPNKYVAHGAKKARVQVKSGKKWKTVKTVKLKKGKATVKVKTKLKKQYRFVFDQTSATTGATSKTIRI
ncbi:MULTISPECIES: hypothetical protein [Micrococcaceae]|uniref:hypothetical protein n=1 Tax=Micrococcaceae TaxID=1268 RepID=UPI0008A34570|nr:MULTISPECIES: hypothetical protein [Micrococcaceae]MCG7303805.1 hypothetical protein [Pseudoglutamicibacter albus]OFT23234.1 hypothetical protein HMPREF3175_05660 [Arthrobacter sp. HMSC08H08]